MSEYHCDKICWGCPLCAHLGAALSLSMSSPEEASQAIALSEDEEWRFLYGPKILSIVRTLHDSLKLAELYALALRSRGVEAFGLTHPHFGFPMIRFQGDRIFTDAEMREKLFATMLLPFNHKTYDYAVEILFGTKECYYRWSKE